MAALPAGLLGLTYWARGELDEALEALRTGMAGFRALGDAAAALSFTFAIADVLLAQGRLREARRDLRGGAAGTPRTRAIRASPGWPSSTSGSPRC